MLNKIIAIDFDGTLCENKWPEIGEPNANVINYIRRQQDEGAKVILWTCREGEELEKALAWCRERELIFDAVNDNIPENTEVFGTNPRKVYAHEYIDDRAIHPNEINRENDT